MNITHEESLSAGSLASLVCTVKYYDFGDDIQMMITWLRAEIVLSNGQERVAISESSGSQQTFISQLTFSPLSAYDENISCSAMAHLVTPNSLIEMSSTKSIVVLLDIEGKIKATLLPIIRLSHYFMPIRSCRYRACYINF